MNAGFEFLGWLDGIVDGRYFPAKADVQRAYARAGWDAVVVRCFEAMDTCAGSTTPGIVEMLDTWTMVHDAAVAARRAEREVAR